MNEGAGGGRIGVYGLCLLGGKNLVPVMGAGVVHALGWRWGFWVMGVGVCGVGLWELVPETFWDRGLETFLERESTGEGGRGREGGG